MIDALYVWCRCPIPGCAVQVYGIRGLAPHCRAHGGSEPVEVLEADEWGEPITNPAAAGVPSTSAARHPSEAS